MALVSVESAARDYDLLRIELRSMKWRTTVMLLGSTFLVFFWFSVSSEFFFKSEFIPFRVARLASIFPIIMSGCAWLLWVAADRVVEFSIRGDRYSERPRDYEDDDLRLLDQVQLLRVHIARTGRYNALLNLFIAAEFATIAIISGFIFVGPR